MYKVRREENRTIVSDWNDKIIYSVENDAIVIYQSGTAMTSAHVSELTDQQLLVALTKAVKINL